MVRQEKETKGIQIGKNEEKLPSIKDCVVFNVTIPKKPTKKLLKLLSELAKSQNTRSILCFISI